MILDYSTPAPESLFRMGGGPGAAYLHMAYDMPVSFTYPAGGTTYANHVTAAPNLGPMNLLSSGYVCYALASLTGGAAISAVLATDAAFIAIATDPAQKALILATIDGRGQITTPPRPFGAVSPGVVPLTSLSYTAWDPGVTYIPGTVVSYTGDYFMCVAGNLNQPPNNFPYGFPYWFPFRANRLGYLKITGLTPATNPVCSAGSTGVGAYLTAGHTYYYTMIPVNDTGYGFVYAIASFTEGTPATKVHVTWDMPTDGFAPDVWQVFRSDTTSALGNFGIIGNTPNALPSFIDDGSVNPTGGIPLIGGYTFDDTANLVVNGEVSFGALTGAVRRVNANTTINRDDYVIVAIASNLTITLPSAASSVINTGKMYVIVNGPGVTGTIVARDAGDTGYTIGGNASPWTAPPLAAAYGSLRLILDEFDTTWFVI